MVLMRMRGGVVAECVNAIAISQVLEVYPIVSIRPKILGIPNWLSFLDFFTRSNTIIGGKKYSLNQIEHAILGRILCNCASILH